MKQVIIYFSLIILLFILALFTYVKYPHVTSSVDEKITSYFLKAREPSPHSEQITIVDIDARSIKELGQWPFSRDKISQVLYNLSNRGAGIIGFDVVFADKDRLSPHHMAEILKVDGKYRNNDILLSDTLLQTPSILGYFFNMTTQNKQLAPIHKAKISILGEDKLNNFNHALGVTNNIDILKTNAYSSGFFNLTDIQNGIVDKTPLLIEFKNKLYPSLAFEMLRIASSSETIIVHNSDLGVIGLELGNIFIPTDHLAQIKLNFRGKGFTFKYIPFVDVYTNNFNKEDVEGKFILIGTSDMGLNDKVPTLYDAEMPGVEVHATTIDNILNSDFFFTPLDSYSYGMFIIFFTTIAVGTILYFLSPIYSFIAFIISLMIILYINYYLIFSKHIVISYFIPIVSLFITVGIYTVIAYYYENQQRKKVFKKLSSKVSVKVAKEILNSDDSILNIKRSDVTIFFSDIRNFTALSENIQDPLKLINILNKYMEPMVESITNHEGTVDKFIGDAIMAYWNAPIKTDNHADLALSSALDQLKKLNELNIELKKEFSITLDIGIGINSGECIVGEMGSSGRSDYTLIGDSVNLASRVEDLTKLYNAKIIITEHTKKLLKNSYKIVKLDTVQVKGKTQKTVIYEVLA